jgi:hypothetical protein
MSLKEGDTVFMPKDGQCYGYVSAYNPTSNQVEVYCHDCPYPLRYSEYDVIKVDEDFYSKRYDWLVKQMNDLDAAISTVRGF